MPGLAKGALEIRDRFLAQDGGDMIINTDEKPVLEDLGIVTIGDGAPSNTFILEERLNPEEYKDIQNFADGFHGLLNLLKKTGIGSQRLIVGTTWSLSGIPTRKSTGSCFLATQARHFMSFRR